MKLEYNEQEVRFSHENETIFKIEVTELEGLMFSLDMNCNEAFQDMIIEDYGSDYLKLGANYRYMRLTNLQDRTFGLDSREFSEDLGDFLFYVVDIAEKYINKYELWRNAEFSHNGYFYQNVFKAQIRGIFVRMFYLG